MFPHYGGYAQSVIHLGTNIILLIILNYIISNSKKYKENTMSLKKETIDLVHKTINGKKATDEELYATLFPPRKDLFSPIKGSILDLNN